MSITIRQNSTGEVRTSQNEGSNWTEDTSLNCDCWLAYWFKLVNDENTRLLDQPCGKGAYTVLEIKRS